MTALLHRFPRHSLEACAQRDVMKERLVDGRFHGIARVERRNAITIGVADRREARLASQAGIEGVACKCSSVHSVQHVAGADQDDIRFRERVRR